jgi:hypothetical protein
MRVYVNYLFECFLVLNIHRCRLNIIIAHTEKLSSVSIPLYLCINSKYFYPSNALLCIIT